MLLLKFKKVCKHILLNMYFFRSLQTNHFLIKLASFSLHNSYINLKFFTSMQVFFYAKSLQWNLKQLKMKNEKSKDMKLKTHYKNT
jgi:hypothetical protein